MGKIRTEGGLVSRKEGKAEKKEMAMGASRDPGSKQTRKMAEEEL
jgi:hypothetical protein